MGTTVERTFVAFMEDPDDTNIPNVIHATGPAREYGYDAALVGGVTVYGWTIPAVRAAVGDAWLEDGWIDLAFRRPVYPDDELRIAVEAEAGGGWTLGLWKADGSQALRGVLGLGRAPWLGELTRPADTVARPRPDALPRLTPDSAPVGADLRPMAVPIPPEEATRYAVEQEADADPLWAGARARIHPSWLAARCTPLIRHSFVYGPAIHARSQIQHLAAAYAGAPVTVSGRFVETYERKGHHYGVVDCLVQDGAGEDLARIRHTTIFQVAKRPRAAS